MILPMSRHSFPVQERTPGTCIRSSRRTRAHWFRNKNRSCPLFVAEARAATSSSRVARIAVFGEFLEGRVEDLDRSFRFSSGALLRLSIHGTRIIDPRQGCVARHWSPSMLVSDCSLSTRSQVRSAFKMISPLPADAAGTADQRRKLIETVATAKASTELPIRRPTGRGRLRDECG